jgi:hypothetical protein
LFIGYCSLAIGHWLLAIEMIGVIEVREMVIRQHAVVVATVVVLAAGLGAQGAGWVANSDVVRKASAAQPAINYDEARVGAYTLPDLLAASGGAIRQAGEWPRRRAVVLELFRQHVYGRRPGRPDQLRFQVIQQQPDAMAGAATLTRVAVVSGHEGREHRFELILFLPNARTGRVPIFLLLNNRAPTNTDATRAERSTFWPAEDVIQRGYGIAALQNNDLAPDDRTRFREGAIRLFEGDGAANRPADAWGAIAAWGWGASRALDYFQTDSRVDASRVAIVGHSRGGKAALWAGAEDERFAMVISNESGEGGAALSRRNFGETTARLTTSFPHWFGGGYARFAGRAHDLPVDQHMLLGLIAPRALYVASADEDLWSDPRGEFLALAHSSPVYALWGEGPIAGDAMPPLDTPLVAGRRGYHVRTGSHNLTVFDWARFADFADANGWRPTRVRTSETGFPERLLETRLLRSQRAPCFVRLKKMNVPLAPDVTMSTVPSLFRSPMPMCEPTPARLLTSSGTNSAPPGAFGFRTAR